MIIHPRPGDRVKNRAGHTGTAEMVANLAKVVYVAWDGRPALIGEKFRDLERIPKYRLHLGHSQAICGKAKVSLTMEYDLADCMTCRHIWRKAD